MVSALSTPGAAPARHVEENVRHLTVRDRHRPRGAGNVKVTFFQGASLRPVPPGSGKDPNSRWVDIYEGELDEEQLTVWIRQAAAIPGWDLT